MNGLAYGDSLVRVCRGACVGSRVGALVFSACIEIVCPRKMGGVVSAEFSAELSAAAAATAAAVAYYHWSRGDEVRLASQPA